MFIKRLRPAAYAASKPISKAVALISVAMLLTGFSPAPRSGPAMIHIGESVERPGLGMQQEELPEEAHEADEEDGDEDTNPSEKEEGGSSQEGPGTEQDPNKQETVPKDDEVTQDTRPEREPLSIRPFKAGGEVPSKMFPLRTNFIMKFFGCMTPV